MEMGDILKKLRETKNLTQIELAEKAGIDSSSVHRYETGKIKVTQETLEKVTKALDITVPDVYAIKDKPSILEDPFTFYRGRSHNSVQILVTLDGTLSNLNSWFATLKKINTALVLVISFSIGAIAQTPEYTIGNSTTDIEYTYTTKGYRTSLEQGLDIKKGYRVEMVGVPYKEGNYSFEYLALVRDRSNEIACYILHAKSSVWGAEYFFCLPIKNKPMMDQFQKDIFSWDKTMLAAYAMFATINFRELHTN